MRLKEYGQYYRQLLKLGGPIVIGQIGMILLGFADTAMVGHYTTPDLAAASFVNSIFNLVIIFATGFSYGLTPIVAYYFARAEWDDMGATLRASVWINMTLSVLIMALLGVLFCYIEQLNPPEELLPLIKPYYIVQLISVPFMMLFFTMKQFFEGIQCPRVPMYAMLIGVAANIFLNWCLIFGKCYCPEEGLLGAGAATAITRFGLAAGLILYFYYKPRFEGFAQAATSVKVRWNDIKDLNKLSWPVGLQMTMEAASFSLCGIMVGWLGFMELATHQVMITVSQIGYMIYYGMAASVAVYVSHYRSQRNLYRLTKTTSAGFHLTLVTALLVAGVVWLLGGFIGDFFSMNRGVRTMLPPLLIPFVVYQFGDALQCNYANALRGLARVKRVILYAFIAYFVISLPSAYYMGIVLDWGLIGIWWSFPLGLTSAGIMYYLDYHFYIRRWKREIGIK